MFFKPAPINHQPTTTNHQPSTDTVSCYHPRVQTLAVPVQIPHHSFSQPFSWAVKVGKRSYMVNGTCACWCLRALVLLRFSQVDIRNVHSTWLTVPSHKLTYSHHAGQNRQRYFNLITTPACTKEPFARMCLCLCLRLRCVTGSQANVCDFWSSQAIYYVLGPATLRSSLCGQSRHVFSDSAVECFSSASTQS